VQPISSGRRLHERLSGDVGFEVTEQVREAICNVPARAWAAAITPDGQVPTSPTSPASSTWI
jgi:hypothetical protein